VTRASGRCSADARFVRQIQSARVIAGACQTSYCGVDYAFCKALLSWQCIVRLLQYSLLFCGSDVHSNLVSSSRLSTTNQPNAGMQELPKLSVATASGQRGVHHKTPILPGTIHCFLLQARQPILTCQQAFLSKKQWLHSEAG